MKVNEGQKVGVLRKSTWLGFELREKQLSMIVMMMEL